MTTATELSLRQLIRERLEFSDDPDPRAIAADLIADLTDEQLTEAASRAIALLATEECRQLRNAAFRANHNQSAKWDKTAESVRAHPDLFLVRVFCGRAENGRPIFKFLKDCDKAALQDAEAYERDHGEAMLRRADQYARLAGKLKRGQRVGDLKLDQVEEVFNA